MSETEYIERIEALHLNEKLLRAIENFLNKGEK